MAGWYTAVVVESLSLHCKNTVYLLGTQNLRSESSVSVEHIMVLLRFCRSVFQLPPVATQPLLCTALGLVPTCASPSAPEPAWYFSVNVLRPDSGLGPQMGWLYRPTAGDTAGSVPSVSAVHLCFGIIFYLQDFSVSVSVLPLHLEGATDTCRCVMGARPCGRVQPSARSRLTVC